MMYAFNLLSLQYLEREIFLTVVTYTRTIEKLSFLNIFYIKNIIFNIKYIKIIIFSYFFKHLFVQSILHFVAYCALSTP